MADPGLAWKHIYFPPFDSGRAPYVIYVYGPDRAEQGKLLATADLQEFEDGRFGSFLASRVRPYTAELFQQCMDWFAARHALEKDYLQLMRSK